MLLLYGMLVPSLTFDSLVRRAEIQKDLEKCDQQLDNAIKTFEVMLFIAFLYLTLKKHSTDTFIKAQVRCCSVNTDEKLIYLNRLGDL